MQENVDNVQQIEQENSEKSENIQQDSQINTENENNIEDSTSDSEENNQAESEESDNSEDELELPEPDVKQEEGKKKKEPPEWLKKKLERDRAAAERKTQEAEELRKENELLKASQQKPPQPQNQGGGQDPYLPVRDNFSSDAEYFLALSDYRDQRRYAEAQYHQRQEAIKEHEEKFQGALKDAIESGKSKYKDFADRTDYILYGDGFPSNRAMAEAIVESQYKDDILYFLGTHVKEAERIARLNPVSAAKEIAKIEVRFDSRKKSNITKAPKILSPLSGGGKGSATYKDPNKMEMDEFRQWYEDKYGSR